MRRESLDLSAKTITAQRHLISKDTEAFTHVKDSNAHVKDSNMAYQMTNPQYLLCIVV